MSMSLSISSIIISRFAPTTVQVAQWLIDEAQADVDSRDNYAQTPLHHAAVKGHATLVQLLLHRGADPVSRDCFGWTPLHAAARSDHSDAALELIKSSEPAQARVAQLKRDLDRAAGLDAERIKWDPRVNTRDVPPSHCARGLPALPRVRRL